jgi:hypothetical protein
MKRLMDKLRYRLLYKLAERDPGEVVGAGAYFLAWDAVTKANPEGEYPPEVVRQAAERMAERILDHAMAEYDDYELPGRMLEWTAREATR